MVCVWCGVVCGVVGVGEQTGGEAQGNPPHPFHPVHIPAKRTKAKRWTYKAMSSAMVMGLDVDEHAWKMRGVLRPPPHAASAPEATTTLATTSPGTRSNTDCGRWQVCKYSPTATDRYTDVKPAVLPT